MYAVIGTNNAKLSLPTMVMTEVETCHDLFYTIDDAETYIEEQTGIPVDDDSCPLQPIEVTELDI
jgi:hypothetical protein